MQHQGNHKDYERALHSHEEAFSIEVFDRIFKGENAIKVFREYRGLTQQELGAKAGISTPYLSQLEHDKRTPSMGTLKALAAALTVDGALLFPQGCLTKED